MVAEPIDQQRRGLVGRAEGDGHLRVPSVRGRHVLPGEDALTAQRRDQLGDQRGRLGVVIDTVDGRLDRRLTAQRIGYDGDGTG